VLSCWTYESHNAVLTAPYAQTHRPTNSTQNVQFSIFLPSLPEVAVSHCEFSRPTSRKLSGVGIGGVYWILKTYLLIMLMLLSATQPCESGTRRCLTTQRCIREDYFCDGDNDCGDYSDERRDQCRELYRPCYWLISQHARNVQVPQGFVWAWFFH